MSMPDANAVIRECLVATGTMLYTLCGTRVYTPVAPRGWQNTTAAVVFEINGGESEVYLPVDYVDVQVRCFGGSTDPRDAWGVYQALHDRLHNLREARLTSGTVVRALEEIYGQVLYLPEVEPATPFVLTQYQVAIRPN